MHIYMYATCIKYSASHFRCHMIMPLQYTQTDTIQFHNVLAHYYKYLHLNLTWLGFLILLARLYSCLVSFRLRVRVCISKYKCVMKAMEHIKISMESIYMTVILVHHSSLLHMTIMYLQWYHVTSFTGYHSMGSRSINGSAGRLWVCNKFRESTVQ